MKRKVLESIGNTHCWLITGRVTVNHSEIEEAIVCFKTDYCNTIHTGRQINATRWETQS